VADPKGFLRVARHKAGERPVAERIHDWRETTLPEDEAAVRAQASRCMDCGIPFCHQGCPLANLIPEWNDLAWRGSWDEATLRLEATNNFPEVTGRVCPAPCEASCVLAIEDVPVTIKDVERAIADRATFSPRPASRKLGTRVAVVGSGPAGLACAQQLARKGHEVVVFERDDRAGGLLRYGIPDFKMEKGVLDRRLEQMRAEGVELRLGVSVGVDPTGKALLREFDAVVLATGARAPRDLDVPGRELAGVHFAMEYLAQQNRRVAGDALPEADAIVAAGRHVIVIGGGDTGSDCVGTAIRQGAASVTQLELMPKPPLVRMPQNPWPAWPLVLRTSTSHEEGCARDWSVMTRALVGDARGRVAALTASRVELAGGELRPVGGGDVELSADLVLLAMGFTGPERTGLVEELGLALDARGNVVTDAAGRTSVPGVFAAGDASRGQSLVVWAIADGRRVAEGVTAALREAPRGRAGAHFAGDGLFR
jgi:glutamate synthase (NADPH/NADH) small chain